MVNVHDIAAYILERKAPITAMKLQKLVYYAQAWSLVWDENPLFGEPVQAWVNGPIVPVLYEWHKGRYRLSAWLHGHPSALSAVERETVDAVLEFYGDKTSQWLGDLTRQEAPWRDARKGLALEERGYAEITHAAMAEYYDGLESAP